jgi:ABC-type uncharacterized transport system auxiliary subunit
MKPLSLSFVATLSGLAMLAAGCQVSLMSGSVLGGGSSSAYYELGAGSAAIKTQPAAGSWQSRAVLKVSPFSAPEKYGRVMLLARNGQVGSTGIFWKSAPGIAVSETLFTSLARGQMFRCVTRESSMTRADVTLNGDVLTFELQANGPAIKAVLEVAVTLTDGNRTLWTKVIREEASVQTTGKKAKFDADAAAAAMNRCMAMVVSRVIDGLQANALAPMALTMDRQP